MGQSIDGLENFIPRDRMVKAFRLREDSILETAKGWIQGHRGDWAILVDNNLWIAVDDKQFKAIYVKYDPQKHCAGPCNQMRPNGL
jgi:hypothetical protein